MSGCSLTFALLSLCLLVPCRSIAQRSERVIANRDSWIVVGRAECECWQVATSEVAYWPVLIQNNVREWGILGVCCLRVDHLSDPDLDIFTVCCACPPDRETHHEAAHELWRTSRWGECRLGGVTHCTLFCWWMADTECWRVSVPACRYWSRLGNVYMSASCQCQFIAAALLGLSSYVYMHLWPWCLQCLHSPFKSYRFFDRGVLDCVQSFSDWRSCDCASTLALVVGR
jgi:hypothetical protein